MGRFRIYKLPYGHEPGKQGQEKSYFIWVWCHISLSSYLQENTYGIVVLSTIWKSEAATLVQTHRRQVRKISVFWLPDVKPSFCHSQEASTTRQMILDINLDSLSIQSSNVVPVWGCRAQSSVVALVEETPYPFSLSYCFNSHAVLEHMPKGDRNVC